MRDLVIWEIAIRIAKADGEAILLSRDQVHSGPLGREEAESAGLLRTAQVDEALEILGLRTPGGDLARSLLEAVWKELHNAGLPIPEEPTLRGVLDFSFESDHSGHVGGTFRFQATTEAGPLRAKAEIKQVAPKEVTVSLSEISLTGRQWESGALFLTVPIDLPTWTTPAEERLAALRETLEDEEDES